MKTPNNLDKHLLWMLMDFSIVRYLIANTKGRLNGLEKSNRHKELSCIFLASKLLCSYEKACNDDRWIKIHDATSTLTDNMDKEIGFDINSEDLDYNYLSGKFFNRFLYYAEKCWEDIERK